MREVMAMDWRHHAACRGTDPELFFPDPSSAPDVVEEAREVCRRCSVIDACLAYALRTRQNSGVWGGQSERERRSLIRLAARTRRRAV